MKNPSRRDFLRQASEAGLSAAAISLGRGTFTGAIPAPDSAPQEVAGEARSKPLGYAVVGIGAIAIGQVMPALAETKLSRLAGLVSGHPEKARHFARIYSVSEKNIYNYESYDQIASNPDIDVVYIALPNSMHPEYTIRGAQAGKHVLSEKPMCASVKDAEDMIATCRQAKRRLMIAYRLRYEPNNVASIQLCRDKQLGALKMIDAEFAFVIGDPKQWRLNKTCGRRVADGHRNLLPAGCAVACGRGAGQRLCSSMVLGPREVRPGGREYCLHAQIPRRRPCQLLFELRRGRRGPLPSRGSGRLGRNGPRLRLFGADPACLSER